MTEKTLKVAREKRQNVRSLLVRDSAGRETVGQHPQSMKERSCQPSAIYPAKLFKNSGEIKIFQGFPGGTVDENLPANAGDTGSSPGLGRSHMPWSN